MKYIRKGNDISVKWSLYNEGSAFNIEGRNTRLILKNAHGKKELDDYTISGNAIIWTFYGKDQKDSGKYSLELVINEGEKGMITTDKCDFVNLVSCSCKLQGGEDAPNVETESIELTSTLEYVAGGMSEEEVLNLLDGKVDKEKGKGLSSNDYTTAEKNKLSSLENYDDSGLRAELSRIDTTKASKEDVEELSERIAENDVLIEDLQNTKIDKEADDYYPQLSVGVADNLSGVEVVDSSFTTRQSGGGAITDGVARVQSIKGNSVVWNQLVSTDRIISLQGDVNITILESGEIYAEGEGESFLGSSLLTPQVPLENGHKYLYNFDVKKDIKETIGVYFGNVWNNPSGGFPIPADTWYHVESIAAPTGELNRGLWIYPWNNTQLTACKAWIKNLVVYDLTKMFGEGNEPSTIEEFYQRIPMGIDLYAYNEGEVISMNVNGIKSVGVKEGEESTEDLSIVGKYFPNGMNGVGSAYDDIRYNKSTNKWEKVVRFGEVELGTLSYIKSGVGANAFYTLSLQGKVKNAGKLLTSQFCQVGGITSSRDAEMSVDSAGTIYFSSFAHTDAASFKAAMAGVILYYELAEPIVTEIDEQDFNTDYLVWNGGTESALASKPSSALRAEITYGFNAVGKIKEIDDKLTELSTEVSGLSENKADKTYVDNAINAAITNELNSAV